MSVQKFRIQKGFSFTTISTKVAQNLKNYEALGLYVYLISLPNKWNFHKSHLSKHANLGRDKINSLIKILESHNLIEIAQMRTQKGAFAQMDLIVKDGNDFKINELEDCAPFTDLPLTANQLLVNSSYKENINKININKKEISKNICASDDAQTQLFDDFWNIYPRKKDKKRVYSFWVKNKIQEKLELIKQDILNRLKSDQQWKNIQFIPYPLTYLRNERWQDEITPIPETQKTTPRAQAGHDFVAETLSKFKNKYADDNSQEEKSCLLLN